MTKLLGGLAATVAASIGGYFGIPMLEKIAEKSDMATTDVLLTTILLVLVGDRVYKGSADLVSNYTDPDKVAERQLKREQRRQARADRRDQRQAKRFGMTLAEYRQALQKKGQMADSKSGNGLLISGRS